MSGELAVMEGRRAPAESAPAGPRSVAVTGAAGYIGRLLLARLAAEPGTIETILGVDVRAVPPEARAPRVVYMERDVRAPDLGEIFARHGTETVVHLAAIVTPRPGETAESAYDVDVRGTENVLQAAARAGATHLVVTSSGAAYGFHADNPEWLRESAPLRGNEGFPYARHKRLVEELLARWRRERPEIRQLIFRPGAILGPGAKNPITELFEKPAIVGVRGAASPFSFVWEDDVIACLEKGIRERREGIYNLAGDGAVPLREIAARLGKPFVPLPAAALRAALAALRRAGLTQYGPEQVDFLAHRSALVNEALKRDFGYTPRRDARAAFEAWCAWRNGAGVERRG